MNSNWSWNRNHPLTIDRKVPTNPFQTATLERDRWQDCCKKVAGVDPPAHLMATSTKATGCRCERSPQRSLKWPHNCCPFPEFEGEIQLPRSSRAEWRDHERLIFRHANRLAKHQPRFDCRFQRWVERNRRTLPDQSYKASAAGLARPRRSR